MLYKSNENMELIKKINEVLFKIKQSGFKAYLVGGSSRDLLLNRLFFDVDIATSMPLKKIRDIFEVEDDTGATLGSIKIKYKGSTMELTMFRKEYYKEGSIYPHIEEFVKTPDEDYIRRDFTINAIYVDSNTMQVIDPSNGVDDLLNFKVRFIGDPIIRIKEDPTRIYRAIRVAGKLNFEIEENSLKAIMDNMNELDRIPSKKKEKELEKIKNDLGIRCKSYLSRYGIIYVGDEND